DLVILNTCHIREKAAEKVYSEIGRIRKMRDARGEGAKQMTIGVAGCVAQAEGEEIIKRAPIVDLVFGPQSYHRLPSLLKDVEAGKSVVETEFPEEDKFKHLPAAKASVTRARGFTAFLTVQEGCDKFCTFCVVPYTRGAEVSRPVSAIVDEARALVAAGVCEITLLGQNVNAYHGSSAIGGIWGLGQLLEELAKIDGLARLRYTTSHPRDMDDALIAAHRDIPQVMPYLHLPVQSGSDRILAAMNRRHTRAEYFELVDKIRAGRPDLALSGDFIVGFPGESDADFADTMSLIRDVEYAQAYSFKYSPRPGTPAASHEDQISNELSSERLLELQTLLTEQQIAFNASKMDSTMDVLLERKGRETGQLTGRSAWLQAVHIDAPETLIGTIQPVRITGVTKNSLSGQLITG
ncbi:MAG: tRNA (N6-isopentenyl adenosine(37)-C2)-methylthiotransferase MiaB, partial [Rhizobiales bacterium]|nr:tRNA (N6-isopentenyl adenosine(37)-C2)-methylthiotransferase MiaB [Hyphomicrobiales bacterium]